MFRSLERERPYPLPRPKKKGHDRYTLLRKGRFVGGEEVSVDEAGSGAKRRHLTESPFSLFTLFKARTRHTTLSIRLYEQRRPRTPVDVAAFRGLSNRKLFTFPRQLIRILDQQI